MNIPLRKGGRRRAPGGFGLAFYFLRETSGPRLEKWVQGVVMVNLSFGPSEGPVAELSNDAFHQYIGLLESEALRCAEFPTSGSLEPRE